MCGRYALHLRPSEVRQRLADQNMPSAEAPDDTDTRLRQSYNFAPGYHGLIYRARTSERGGNESQQSANDDGDGEPSPKKAKLTHASSSSEATRSPDASTPPEYILQSAKWGLIPFWTKRPPDYTSQLRTINCRDDSLARDGGMWNTMKQRKRCVVVAEGFYEWLKKNGGKEKVPHFVKRRDGGLMCLAGLWDCVRYEDGADGKEEGEGKGEGLWSYTIITTDSNRQLNFLHDRMPVILEPGSEEMKAWLDPENVGWGRGLQRILRPFEGELECYAVDKAVGKVGNNSPQFVIPVDSKANKNNIANFFGKQEDTAGEIAAKNEAVRKDDGIVKAEKDEAEVKQEPDADENRQTSTKVLDPETNAPLPRPSGTSDAALAKAMYDGQEPSLDAEDVEKGIKRSISELDDESLLQAADEAESPAAKKQKEEPTLSPRKTPPAKTAPAKPTPPNAKTKSATSNPTRKARTPVKGDGEGNAKITRFFGK